MRNNINNINNINNMLIAAAIYLENGDVIGLMSLQETVNEWLQTEEEREAQIRMLDAMIDAID